MSPPWQTLDYIRSASKRKQPFIRPTQAGTRTAPTLPARPVTTMPYRGKPSKGCQECRKRKIRCDQRTPGCLNCEKVGRPCPGYRDQTDLMFFDETAGVAEKARKSSLPGRTSRSTPDLEKQTSNELRQSASVGDTPRSLSPDLEIQATTFFFDNFAVDGEQSMQSRFFADTSSSTTPGPRALMHSIRALGLAGLSRVSEAPQLMRTAEAQYLESIRSMNIALGIAEEARKDSTLLAVLILTIFETVAVSESHTLTAWSNHVQGAAALLDARGPEQFNEVHGFRLFVQAAIPICTNCIQQGIRLPEPVTRLLAEAKKRRGPFDPVMTHFEHKIAFADFYGQVKSRQLTDLETVLTGATDLDGTADANLQGLQDTSPHLSYRTISIEASPRFPLGYYHHYTYFFAAEVWNGNRAMRILLNQMIRSVLLLGMTRRPPLFTDRSHTDLLHASTANLYTLQKEVIASVPQYMGWVGSPPTSPKGKQTASRSPPRADPTSRFLWSNFSTTVWSFSDSPPLTTTTTTTTTTTPTSYSPTRPTTAIGSNNNNSKSAASLPLVRSNGVCHLPSVLSLLGTIDIATDETKTWAIQRLKEISRGMGARQAGVLAERLERGEVREGWWRDLRASSRVGSGEGSDVMDESE